MIEKGKFKMPPMDDELRYILGKPNFTTMGICQNLRKMGVQIKEKAEDEQAAAIYWMLTVYFEHGESWREKGTELLKAAGS
jgi:hypothetical protein